MRKKVTLCCDECGMRNYTTNSKKDGQAVRLELKKFCSTCNRHTIHKETK